MTKLPHCDNSATPNRHDRDFLARSAALAHAYRAARRIGLDKLRPAQCWQLRRRLGKAMTAADRAGRGLADLVGIVCGARNLADPTVIEAIDGLAAIDERGSRDRPAALCLIVTDSPIVLSDREALWRVIAGLAAGPPPRPKRNRRSPGTGRAAMNPINRGATCPPKISEFPSAAKTIFCGAAFVRPGGAPRIGISYAIPMACVSTSGGGARRLPRVNRGKK